MNKTKKIVLMGLFIALSVVCSFIKLPSPTGTIAFDSLPAYAAGILLGGIPGAVVGFMGHMATALSAGFPLTLPVHITIAVVMAVTILLFNFTYKKTNIFFASIVGIIVNGVGAPLLLALILNSDAKLYISFIPFLIVGSAANVIAADVVCTVLQRSNLGFEDSVKKNEI